MVKYIYFFYDHLNPDFPAEKIRKAILEDKDWDYFKKQMNHWGKIYLPDQIDLFDENGLAGSVKMTKNTFYRITDSDYECG